MFLTYEIDKFVGQDPGNYNDGNSNGSKSTKYFKFIRFFVNNRSGHSDLLTTTLEIIYVDFNNVKDEIDKYVGQDPGNYSNGNGSSSIRGLTFISFFVKNR